MGKINEIKKEMLNYLMSRTYPNSELNTFTKNYKEDDCYNWTQEKIDDAFNLFEKLVGFADEDSSANREIGYYRGYRDAIESKKKKF